MRTVGNKRALILLKRVILISGLVFLGIFSTAGCGTLETLLQNNNVQEKMGSWLGGEAVNVPAQVNLPEKKTVSLYFADSSGKYLIREERTIPNTLSLARETVIQWLKGPQGKNIQPVVSPETTLLDISIKDGLVTVDLSKEFTKPYQNITPEIEIYGLVNTLTQFDTIREVCLRIEGKMLNKLGNIDTGHLTNNPDLIKDLTEVNSISPTSGSAVQGTSQSNTGISPGNTGQPVAAKSSVISDSPSKINLFVFPPS